ncbi:MAG TPA: hypothetical protein VHF69_04225 [Candidatus Synoicihabitans sp.]|nr:hypothetical protein [Candidatus Synoicihabitans sp.]
MNTSIRWFVAWVACDLAVGSMLLATEPTPERRMSSELMRLLHADAQTAPRDPKLEDLTADERADIDRAPPPDPPQRREQKPAPSEEGEPPLELDPVIVEGRRTGRLKHDLQAHDYHVHKEQQATKPTTLDSILNHRWLSWLGPYSAETRAAIARRNIRIMDTERQLLIAIQTAPTEEERRQLQQYLAELRQMRQW